MTLDFRSQLCTFENSAKSNEISFDPDSFSADGSILQNQAAVITAKFA